MEINMVLSSDVLDIRDGTHDSPKYIEKGYPLLTSKNLKENGIDYSEVNYISEVDYIKINNRSKVHKGDILYSMIGSIGNMVLVDEEPNFAIKNVALFKFNNDSIFNKYFYYVLKSNFIETQIKSQQKGGTQKFVTLKILRNLKIPLPLLAEQQRIAQILDTAAELRDKTKAVLQQYDALAQSIFLDMFGDLELFEKKELKKTVDFIDYRGRTPKKTDKGIPLLTAKNIKNGFLSTAPKEYIDTEDYLDWMTRGFPNEGDVLFTTEAPLGNACLLPKYEKVALAQRTICFQCFDFLNNRFLLFLLISNYFKNQLNKRQSGSTVKGIRSKELASIPIPIPPIQLQNQFAEKIANIEQQKTLAQQELQETENLFNCLLQKAFKGEL